ncbi:MAG: hypothetical protein ACRDGO_08870 [Actinomycetota bacterium]
MKRSLRRWGVIIATIAATLVVTASSALAKGPESVTLTGPGIDGPIELDTTSPGLLGRAMGQTGLWWSARGDRPLPLREPPPEDLGPGYTLTWILYGEPGERTEERTIRQLIYPFARGGVVVHTPRQGSIRSEAEGAGWFEAPALQETLAGLGVPVDAASALNEAHIPQVAEGASPERKPAGGGSPSLVVAILGLSAALAVVIGAHRTLIELGWIRGRPHRSAAHGV